MGVGGLSLPAGVVTQAHRGSSSSIDAIGRSSPANHVEHVIVLYYGHAVKLTPRLVLLVAVTTCIGASAFMMPYIPDDSYISFRYAENLANGHGLTFNEGERPVEGYSNFLWILLCVLFYKIGLSLPVFVPFFGAFVAVCAVVLLWAVLGRRQLQPLQLLFPLLILASSGPFVMYAVSGMEMPLYALLFLLSLFWLDGVFETGGRGTYVALAVTGVLLSLCRPEGIVAFPVIALMLIRFLKNGPPSGSRRNLVIATVVFLLAVIAYNVWRVSYFGEWFPTPFLSKAGGGKSLVSAWTANAGIYFTRQGDYFPPLGYYFAALVLGALAGRSLSWSKPQWRQTEIVSLVLAVVLIAVYINFKDWMPGMRYHSALVGLLLLPAAQVQTPFFNTPPSKRSGAHFWLIGFAVVAMNLAVLADLRIITAQTERSNRASLIALGGWLREIMPPDATLAVSDVGALPYYSGFKTIDIHPESLTDLHIAKMGFSNDYFFERKPDILVLSSRSILQPRFYPEHFEMTKDARFDELYRFIGVSRYDWFHDRCYWVFIPKWRAVPNTDQMERFPHGLGDIDRKLRL